MDPPIAAVDATLAALIILSLLLVGGLALFIVAYVLSGGRRDPKPLYQAAGSLLAAVTLAASTFFAASKANESATEDVTQKVEKGNQGVTKKLSEEIQQATKGR